MASREIQVQFNQDQINEIVEKYKKEALNMWIEHIDDLIELRNNWYELERQSGEVVWGECAYEIDMLIEKLAGEK